MNKRLFLLSLTLCTVSTVSLARPGSAPAGFSHGTPTGPSQSQAIENSNGRFATDRETGLERAEERRNEHAKKHSKTKGHDRHPPESAEKTPVR